MEKLSLIDFASEDDLLISSSADGRRDLRPSEHHEGEHNCFVLEPASAHEGENLLKMSQQCEHVPEMSESPEQKRAKSGKVNLRKSLAWDSAFFTNEGVLNTEELASVNNTFRKTEARSLPGIQEELRRSAESTSTLDSESCTLESIEEDLFENVRASIQKTLGKGDIRTRGVPTASRARKKVETAAQTKVKPHVAVKTDVLSRQHLDCSKESVLGGKEAAQARGDSKIFLKPPRILLKPTSLSSVPSNKDLSGNVQLKNTLRRTSSGSGANQQGIVAFSKTNGESRNTISRSVSSLKPNPGSHQGAVSCSPNGSPVSGSSHSAAGMSPSEPTRKRSAARNKAQALPGSTTRTPVRALKSKLGPSNSTYKFSPKASPRSSMDSVVSDASSSTSASIKPSNSVESLASSTSSSPSWADEPRIRKEIPANLLQIRTVAKASVGTRVSSEHLNRDLARSSINGNAAPKSSRPSGLRMPSPKIGYFDAEKTQAGNSNRAPQAGAKNGLPRASSGTGDTVGGSKLKSSKIPSIRPASQNVSVSGSIHRPPAQRTSLESPMSLRRQPQPSQENRDPSREADVGSHGIVCTGAAGEDDADGDKRETSGDGRDGHMTDEVHSVSMEFQENMFPDQGTDGLIQQHSRNEYQKISPADIMEKMMASLSLSEAADLVDGN